MFFPKLMRVLSGLAILLLFVGMPRACFAQPASDAWTLLTNLQRKYDDIKDYSVDIIAVLNVPGLSVPEMYARLYYRQPDKVHIESDGFAMLPRDAIMFHPSMFDRDDYDAIRQGSRNIRSTECEVITLLAKSDTVRVQRASLFIDPVRARLLRLELDPLQASSASADFTWIRVAGSFDLPKTIDIRMKSHLKLRRRDTRRGTSQRDEDQHATVRLTYSNYRVNQGIPDEVFERTTTLK